MFTVFSPLLSLLFMLFIVIDKIGAQVKVVLSGGVGSSAVATHTVLLVSLSKDINSFFVGLQIICC